MAEPIPLALDQAAPTSCPECASELARVYRPGAPEERLEITSPEAAAEVLMPMLQDLDREHCLTLNLDTKHRRIATTTVSIAPSITPHHTSMSPREVFRDALLDLTAHRHRHRTQPSLRRRRAVARRRVGHTPLGPGELDGDDVFALYEYELTTGEVLRNTEVLTVRDVQIIEVQLFFRGRVAG